MDIKIVEATPTDVEKLEAKIEESIEQKTLEGSMGDEISTIAIHQVLELEGAEQTQYKESVQTLLEWAKETADSDDPTALKWAIRDLQMRVSTPLYGDRIRHLARFAYLDLEEKRIKQEKRSFH